MWLVCSKLKVLQCTYKHPHDICLLLSVLFGSFGRWIVCNLIKMFEASQVRSIRSKEAKKNSLMDNWSLSFWHSSQWFIINTTMLKGEVEWFLAVLLSNYLTGDSKWIDSVVTLKCHPLLAQQVVWSPVLDPLCHLAHIQLILLADLTWFHLQAFSTLTSGPLTV